MNVSDLVHVWRRLWHSHASFGVLWAFSGRLGIPLVLVICISSHAHLGVLWAFSGRGGHSTCVSNLDLALRAGFGASWLPKIFLSY